MFDQSVFQLDENPLREMVGLDVTIDDPVDRLLNTVHCGATKGIGGGDFTTCSRPFEVDIMTGSVYTEGRIPRAKGRVTTITIITRGAVSRASLSQSRCVLSL
uniref:Uncharacterized protein n=1 Tax=Cacopsylla melanoneura TaxID=428564 RepID=A0A8D8UHF5_9HEMI